MKGILLRIRPAPLLIRVVLLVKGILLRICPAPLLIRVVLLVKGSFSGFARLRC